MWCGRTCRRPGGPGMSSVIIGYTPTPRQREFHECDCDEALFGGAAGGGKSRALIMDALNRCLAAPGSCAYLFRRTYPELEDTLVPMARAAIPGALGDYHGGRHEFRLKNGSILRFRACQNDSDRFGYQGAEIHFLYIDELTRFSRTVYEFLKSRVRAPRALGVRPVVRCSANPGGPGHGWVKAYFIAPMPQGGRITREVRSDLLGRSQRRTVAFIPARATDNPHLPEDYIFELEQKPPALRNALLLGLWDAFEGQVFTEWTDDPAHYADGLYTHVIHPFSIPLEWKRWRSFDFGYARPFSVGWWAVDPGGRLYRYREWYGSSGQSNTGCRMEPREIARGIRRIEAADGPVVINGVADPSIFDGSRGESIAGQMEREGVFFLPGDNARLAGKMQLHHRLRFDREGRPGLYVFTCCRDFIRTLPALTYAAGGNMEDVDTQGEDHIYDETRYLLTANPVAAPPPPPAPRPYDPLEKPKPRTRMLP